MKASCQKPTKSVKKSVVYGSSWQARGTVTPKEWILHPPLFECLPQRFVLFLWLYKAVSCPQPLNSLSAANCAVSLLFQESDFHLLWNVQRVWKVTTTKLVATNGSVWCNRRIKELAIRCREKYSTVAGSQNSFNTSVSHVSIPISVSCYKNVHFRNA